MILALLGLPILFLYLAVVGSSLASAFRRFYSFVCCCKRRKGRDRGRASASNNSTLEKSGASSSSEQPFSKSGWPSGVSGSSGHLNLCQDCSSARRRRELRCVEESSVQVLFFWWIQWYKAIKHPVNAKLQDTITLPCQGTIFLKRHGYIYKTFNSLKVVWMPFPIHKNNLWTSSQQNFCETESSVYLRANAEDQLLQKVGFKF